MPVTSIKSCWLRLLVSCALLTFAGAALAQDAATDGLTLRIEGEIAAPGQDEAVVLTRSRLEALGLTRLETETPWTEGLIAFEGVLGRDILRTVGATGNTIDARALNDYGVTIPVADFEDYDVIIATRINGAPLSVRDRGPFWVIYPWSDNPSLQSDLYYSRAIWQLKSIRVFSE